jgi:hypothetical protein
MHLTIIKVCLLICYASSLNYEPSLNDSIRQMMILRNNQGDCLRVGFSKQSRSAAARIVLQKTDTVDCSKSIISLDFFEYFLCQDKKYCRFGVATPKSNIIKFSSHFF